MLYKRITTVEDLKNEFSIIDRDIYSNEAYAEMINLYENAIEDVDMDELNLPYKFDEFDFDTLKKVYKKDYTLAVQTIKEKHKCKLTEEHDDEIFDEFMHNITNHSTIHHIDNNKEKFLVTN